ncbi:MAG: TetR/AcrR family transcriptional regulator [Candidatus Dojkabacteria bacterium]
MARKVEFNREDIINAAFKVVQKGGMKTLTARNIARRLNASTAPVYAHFRSMKKLKKKVFLLIKDTFLEYLRTPYSDDRFFNQGIGYIMFAKKEPHLFNVLFTEKNTAQEACQNLNELLLEDLNEVKELSILSKEDKLELLRKMWIYSHGIATLSIAGVLPSNDNEFLIELFAEGGEDIIGNTLKTKKDHIKSI